MQYQRLGKSGLLVSDYVFGTLTFAGTNGFEALGSVNDGQGRRMIDIALDAGVNAIDTANLYSKGDAEVIVGKALAGRRDSALIFSKAGSPMTSKPNDSGTSRKHLVRQVDDSLRRLQTDYLDLLFLHRWDGVTPIEETVQTMGDLIRAGKLRYWGLSNYSGWQVASTVHTAKALSIPTPIAHQLYYTAAAREAEYELIPAGEELGLGSMVWSPLGQGLLTGQVSRDQAPAAGTRQATAGWLEPYVVDKALLWNVVDALIEIGEDHGVSAAQVALAWVRQRPGVHSVVLGARNEEQLTDNLASRLLELSNEECARIEALARPAPLYPYWHRSMWATERASPSEQSYLEGHRKTIGLD